jgi:hypothetical protein
MPLKKTLLCYLKHIRSKTFDTKNIVRISFGELYKKEYGVIKNKKILINIKSNSSPLNEKQPHIPKQKMQKTCCCKEGQCGNRCNCLKSNKQCSKHCSCKGKCNIDTFLCKKVVTKRKDRDYDSIENAVDETSLDSFEDAMKEARDTFNDAVKSARALKFIESDSSSENVFNRKPFTNQKIVEKVVQPSQIMIDLKKCIEEESSIDDNKQQYKEAFIQRKSKRLKSMYEKSANAIDISSNQSLEDALKIDSSNRNKLKEIREEESDSDTSSPIHEDDIVSLSLNGHALSIPPYPLIVDINNLKDSDSILTTSIDGGNVT